MERILSEEELNALLELFQPAATPRAEGLPEENGLMAEHELHRKFFRLSQRLPAVLRVDGENYQVEAVNISLGGIFIRGPLELPVDKQVEMKLELPCPRVGIGLSGQVCWQKKDGGRVIGLGIRFSSLPIEAIWAILANTEQARNKD
jgi:hypothetical protein